MFDGTALEEFTGRLAARDASLDADDDLIALVRTIATARRYLDAAEAAALVELDARGTTDIEFGHRTAQWLVRDTGMSPAAAALRLKTARTLHRELPATNTAVREGTISHDQAKVMAGAVNPRIVSEFGAVEADLLVDAASMGFDRWKRHVNAVAALLDQDGGYDPNEDVANNRLTLVPGPDGTRLSGNLVGDAALVVEQAVARVTDQLYRQYRKDCEESDGAVEVPSQSTLRALAIAEICRRTGDTATGRSRATVTLVVNTGSPDDVFDPDGMARTGVDPLLCDVSIRTIIVNSLGVPLDMGREVRTATDEQRRALAVRDGGCVFPGCGLAPQRCDGHHVAHWVRDLGTTDVRRMVFLCRHHHGVIHRKGWNITLGDDGWAWITTPTGRTVWCQRHGTVRAGPGPPIAA